MRYFGGVLVLALALGVTSHAWSQDSKSSKSGSTKTDSKADTTKEREGKARGVLPQYYRQIGLSEEQRQKVYKIQNEYSDKIDDLEKKIDALKAERNSRYLKELTKAQRDRLEELKKAKDKDEKDK